MAPSSQDPFDADATRMPRPLGGVGASGGGSAGGPSAGGFDAEATVVVGVLRPGEVVFGRYRLEAVVGRGGMGVVWSAVDQELGTTVALKFLPEIVARDAGSLVDLKRETRRSRDLTHTHIVRIHDFHSDGQRAAISMELLTGGTLAERLAKHRDDGPGCFEVAEIEIWVRQIVEALAYAHGEGVVHRDLKPANLLLDGQGRIKISDCGIAASLTDSVSRVSRSAGTSGTPCYMSPQQMLGESPAVTDDVYALGAAIYELLTGRPPFFSGHVAVQVLQKPATPLTARRADLRTGRNPIPEAWERAILACLAKETTQRPAGVKDVAERLNPVAPKVRPQPVRPWLAAQPRRYILPARPSSEAFQRPPPPATSPPAAAPRRAPEPRVPPPQVEGGPRKRAIIVTVVVLVLAALGWWVGIRVPVPVAQTPVLGSQSPVVGQAAKVDLGGGAALDLVWMSPGAFTMGSPASETGRHDSERQTQVLLTKGYWLGKYEVTQAQWQALMGSNPAHFQNARRDAPVEQISWDQATEFCRKLTEQEQRAGRLPVGYRYALPTEAQWEYAARAGRTGPYGGTGNLEDMGWYSANSGNATKPVGQKRANAWGLHDMHGNVWEWCADRFGTYSGGNVTDPTGPTSGSSRVYRGGSYYSVALFCRSAFRYWDSPGDRNQFLGFRLALSSSP